MYTDDIRLRVVLAEQVTDEADVDTVLEVAERLARFIATGKTSEKGEPS